MDYVEGKNLMELECLSMEEAMDVTLQLAQRLTELKSCGIIHNDIKPENVIWNRDQKVLKIIDFGHSIIGEKVKMKITDKATLIYSAPEFFSSENVLTNKSDSWSLGILLKAWLTKRLEIGYFAFQSVKQFNE